MWLERLYDVINPTHPAFGSSMNIMRHASRTSKIFDSLKTFWIWPMLHQLDSSKRFLSRLLSLVDLGSFIDSRALANHVIRIPLVQLHRPALFMRDAKDGYVIAELVKFLHGTERGSIHAGAMFTQYVVVAFTTQFSTLKNTNHFSRHIIDKKIPVELTVLCRLLENVTGSFIMARAFNTKGSFHGVTLPRSWILENVQKLHRVQNKVTNLRVVWVVVTLFQDLLERVYNGNDTDSGEANLGKYLSVAQLD